ncbi:MAG: hypothetical protein ACN4GZ_07435, partial [Acidimicrobiales bacterium]
YQSAQALSSDLSAFLGGKPIAARPVSSLNRLGKLIARNRIAAALSSTTDRRPELRQSMKSRPIARF